MIGSTDHHGLRGSRVGVLDRDHHVQGMDDGAIRVKKESYRYVMCV